MTPFRPLLKDYFLVCETYYAAIRTASPRQIEAIDRDKGEFVLHFLPLKGGEAGS